MIGRAFSRIKKILKKQIKNKEKLCQNDVNRYKSFMDFNTYINYDQQIINYYRPRIKEKYDMYVYGSDQIWNYSFEGKTPLFLGTFAPKEKNISYAASFGVDDIPIKYKKIYKEALNNFKAISVRETQGVKIIKELCDINVNVNLDPTLLLEKTEWKEVSKKPNNKMPNRYILCYFLGNLSDSRKIEIEKFANENKCKIINILDSNSDFYCCGPSEFIYLIENSFLILTDSFHACVFSVIFDKSFVVFDREDNNKKMNSRIDNLIEKLELKNRKFNGKINDYNLYHDYSRSFEIIKNEKEKALKYLKKSL